MRQQVELDARCTSGGVVAVAVQDESTHFSFFCKHRQKISVEMTR